MKVKDILKSGLVNRDTVVVIRKNDVNGLLFNEEVLAHGREYDVLAYYDYPVRKAFWYDSNRMVIFIVKKAD